MFYGLALLWNASVFCLHALLSFLLDTCPHDLELPFRLTNLSEQLRKWKAFNTDGFSFDPQRSVQLFFFANSSAQRFFCTDLIMIRVH